MFSMVCAVSHTIGLLGAQSFTLPSNVLLNVVYVMTLSSPMVEPSKFAPSLVSVDSVNTHFQSVGFPENASSLVSADSLTTHFQPFGGAKFTPSLAGGVSDTTHFQSEPSSKSAPSLAGDVTDITWNRL